MVSYTQAVAGDTTTSLDHVRRGFAHTRGDATTGAVNVGHTRRLFQYGRGDATTGAVDVDHTRRRFDFGVSDSRPRYTNAGIPIPSSEFRYVEVELLDDKDNPLANAVWVQSAGIFPTSARVEETKDGSMIAHVWLLDGIAYNSFLCLGENPETAAEYDFVWYEATGSSDVGPHTKRATLKFKPAKPTSPLNAGTGVFFG